MLPAKFPGKADPEDYDDADESEKAGLLVGDDGGGRDDFFLLGPGGGGGGGAAAATAGRAAAGTDRLADVKSQVSQVTGVMRQNMEKILDRGAGLGRLEEQSEQLAGASDDFYITSRQVQRRMYMRDLKMKVALAVVILVLMLIIILPIILKN